jgi:uncharacterized membrane protein YGL010W
LALTAAVALSVALSVALIQSVFYVELRHRWGVEPLVLAASAVGLLRLWTGVRGSPAVTAKASR